MPREPGTLTAYAMRSPFGSEESWVGRPRSVLGEAARILSSAIDIFRCEEGALVGWSFEVDVGGVMRRRLVSLTRLSGLANT